MFSSWSHGFTSHTNVATEKAFTVGASSSWLLYSTHCIPLGAAMDIAVHCVIIMSVNI